MYIDKESIDLILLGHGFFSGVDFREDVKVGVFF
jgi:hypothetical protein